MDFDIWKNNVGHMGTPRASTPNLKPKIDLNMSVFFLQVLILALEKPQLQI
jgi:hypothetical protein